jgi:hypothetical protein
MLFATLGKGKFREGVRLYWGVPYFAESPAFLEEFFNAHEKMRFDSCKWPILLIHFESL